MTEAEYKESLHSQWTPQTASPREDYGCLIWGFRRKVPRFVGTVMYTICAKFVLKCNITQSSLCLDSSYGNNLPEVFHKVDRQCWALRKTQTDLITWLEVKGKRGFVKVRLRTAFGWILLLTLFGAIQNKHALLPVVGFPLWIRDGRKTYRIMHELSWITIFFVECGYLPIVVHGYDCIILFRKRYFLSWTHSYAKNNHRSFISPRMFISDIAL